MDIDLEPGKYLVAVSGGVDSVSLLDLLAARPEYELTVVHFDHGIRDDSTEDRQFVEEISKKYGLPFIFKEGKLGADTSETQAREHRYRFLHDTLKATGANAVITAHHQDDLIETIFINIMRGTNRKGLSSLVSREYVRRPLLGFTKKQMIEYAKNRGLDWHDDPTNDDKTIIRNYIRHKILPKMTDVQRQQIVQIARESRIRNELIDALLINHLHLKKTDHSLDRGWFIGLPHIVAREILAHWLRQEEIEFDSKGLERLVANLKTLPVGTRTQISSGWHFEINAKEIRLSRGQSV